MSTNTTTNPNPVPPPSTPVAWIGFDWGHKEHAFALETAARDQREEGSLKHSAELLHNWLHQIEQRFGGRPVALAIETSRGAVIHALLQYPWLMIYPINPVTSARYRQAFTPSGASDDLPDARVLLELVRDHSDKLRPLQLQDSQTLKLANLVEVRRDMVDRRTQVLNQLNSLLVTYYPQATELVGKLDSDLAVGFLTRWPELISLKTAKPSTIKRFYHAQNLRRPELLEARLKLIANAVPLTTDQARVAVAVLQLRLLLDQLRAFRKHIAILEAEIKTVFAGHCDAHLFRNLPGAGPALAPRLCVAFGTDRTLYPDPQSLQKLAGIAPVREKSGQQLWTHWRWFAPAFLRQTFVEWAAQTAEYSTWAKLFYRRMEAKGKSRQTILRALAFRWIRVLWKCWQTRTPYDEATYLKQLLHRKSPNAAAA